MLQTSWQCTRSLHALTVRRNVVECWLKNVLRWFLPTDLQTGTLVTFTLYIVTSEITESCTNDLGIYIGLQNLCFLKRWTISLIGMWMLVLDSGGNDLSVFLRSNDTDLDFFFFFFFFYQNELHILLIKTKIYRNNFKKIHNKTNDKTNANP